MAASAERNPEAEKARALEILDAASSLLTEAGTSAFSAAAVARRAGVNKALIFYYWGSVAELFERVLEGYYERQRAAIEATQSDGTVRERVHAMIDAYIDFMRDNQAYARVVQQEIAGGGAYADVVARHFAATAQWVVERVQSLVPETPEKVARHLHVSITGVVATYFTYARALAEAWDGCDPLSEDALAERRAHVHWVVDAWLDALSI